MIEYNPETIWEQFKQHCVDILSGEDNWEYQFDDMIENLRSEITPLLNHSNDSKSTPKH